MAQDDDNRVSITLNDGVSRREIMKQLGMASAAAGAFGGFAGSVSGNQADGDGNGDGPDQVPEYQEIPLIPPPTELSLDSEWPEREVVTIVHETGSAYWTPVMAGVQDAARQLGWDATFTGPSQFDVEEQVSILESTIDSGPDVITTTIADADAYNDAINRALEEDIHVQTFNTNALSRDEMRDVYGRALAFTGQDPLGAGYATGLSAIDRLPDDANLATISTCCPGMAHLEVRTRGMELAFEQESDIELTQRVNHGQDAAQGVSTLENHIVSNPDVDAILGTDAFTSFIGEAINNQNAQDDVVAGGFDLVEASIEQLNQGNLDFLIGDDPYAQGYMPIMQSWMYLERGMPPKDYGTGAEIVTQDTADFVQSRDWGTLREFQRTW